MSKRGPTREELQALKRTDLQKLAKDHNIKANLKSDALIDEIFQASAAQASPHAGTSTLQRDKSGAQLSADGQENQPDLKATDSSIGSSGNGSPVRVRRPIQTKPGSAAPKSKVLPGGGGPRRPPGTRGMVVPPGVAAANSDPKGKGRARKSGYSGPPRAAAMGSKLPIAKTVSMESVKTDIVDQDVAMLSSGLTPPLREASHSASNSLASLSARIGKLEHAREASRERREAEIANLRSQLKAAHESINVLAKKNDALKAQIDAAPPAATPQEVAAVLVRVTQLEEQFHKMNFGSEQSSDDIPYAAAQPRNDFQTPPNRVVPSRGRNSILAPEHLIINKKPVGMPRTPPPRLGRYAADPDESPSPKKPRRKTDQVLSYPMAESLPPVDPEPPETKGKTDRPRRGRLSRAMEPEREYESDDPIRSPHSRAIIDSCDEDAVSEKDAPLETLPFPIHPDLSTAASTSRAWETSSSRVQRRSKGRASRGNLRSHPYVKRDVPRGYSSSPGADIESHGGPKDYRDIFGATPDPSRIPPNPFENGTIPPLNIGGRPSLAHLAVQETPLSSPSRTLALPVVETPPASRTRYGTEFGTTMKTRFSD